MAPLPFTISERAYTAAMKAFQGVLQGISNNTRLSPEFLAAAKPQVQAFYDYIQLPTAGRNSKIIYPSASKPYRGEISKLRTALNDAAAHIMRSPGAFYEYSENISTFMSAGFIALPIGLNWDSVRYPLNITVTDAGSFFRATGDAGLTPRANFDRVSTARTAPSVVYYVDGNTGNDSNNGLTVGTAFATIIRAISVANANASATTAKIIVAAGEYARNNGFIGTNVAKDMSFETSGGRVLTGAFDVPSVYNFTVDTTFTNCYSTTLGAIERVLDRNRTNMYGSMDEGIVYASANALNTATNITTLGWVFDSGTGKLYIRRPSNEAVTYANTRIIRSNIKCFETTNNVSIYMEGFDFIGGGPISPINYWPTTVSATEKALSIVDCTAGYSGGNAGVPGRGISVTNLNGLAYIYNFKGRGNREDFINVHDYINAGTYVLTVNCEGIDTGRYTGQSCNGYTLHETVRGIDIAGWYSYGRGGTGAIVNDARVFLVSTYFGFDLGDVGNGGAINPVAVRTEGNVRIWSWKAKFEMPAGALLTVISAGSILYDHGSRFSAGGVLNGGSGPIIKF